MKFGGSGNCPSPRWGARQGRVPGWFTCEQPQAGRHHPTALGTEWGLRQGNSQVSSTGGQGMSFMKVGGAVAAAVTALALAGGAYGDPGKNGPPGPAGNPNQPAAAPQAAPAPPANSGGSRPSAGPPKSPPRKSPAGPRQKGANPGQKGGGPRKPPAPP